MKKAMSFFIACAIVAFNFSVISAQEPNRPGYRRLVVEGREVWVRDRFAPHSGAGSQTTHNPPAVQQPAPRAELVFFKSNLGNKEAEYAQLIKVLRALNPGNEVELTTDARRATTVYEISVRRHTERGRREPDRFNQEFNRVLDHLSYEARRRAYRKGGRLGGDLLRTGIEFGAAYAKREPYRSTDDVIKLDVRIRQFDSSGRAVKEAGGYLTFVFERKGGRYRPETIKLVDGSGVDAGQVLAQAQLLPDPELEGDRDLYLALTGASYFLLLQMK